MKTRFARTVGAAAAIAVAGLFGLGAATAQAAPGPTPNAGPTSGGTTVTIPAPESPKYVALAGTGSGALTEDGDAVTWGDGYCGLLGNGTGSDDFMAPPVISTTPVLVHAPAGVRFTELSTGSSRGAIGDDGHVYTWGCNRNGELGDGTTTFSNVPVQVQVPAGVTFTTISMGRGSALALGSDGNAYGWGQRSGNSTVPVTVALPAGVQAKAVFSGGNYSLVIGSDGNAYTWFGSNPPTQVAAPAGVSFTTGQASMNSVFFVALGSDGKAYAWGDNNYGQLGNGTNTSSSTPVPIQTPSGVTFTKIMAGYDTAQAIGSDGKAYLWGGQNFPGFSHGSTVPEVVEPPVGVAFTDINAGYGTGHALGDDGKVYSWGANYNGDFGDGTTDSSAMPVAAQMPAVVVTGVTFGGTVGTDLTPGAGDVTVKTPAHAAGPVDVSLDWTLGGVAQTPILYPGGFTYQKDPVAPTVSNPKNVTIGEGKNASFTVTATGTPAPAVTWEVSADGGRTWKPIAADSSATVSADGLTLTVTAANRGHDGHMYRATASNSAGSQTSEAATLTVQAKGGTANAGADGNSGSGSTGGNGSTTTAVTTDLAETGGSAQLPLILAGASLLTAGGAIGLHLLSRRRIA